MIKHYRLHILLAIAAFGVAAVAQPQLPTTSTPAPETSKDLVVLRVAGEPITETQVIAAISVLARQKQLPANSQQERNLNLFKGAVDNIIIQTLLKREGQRLNLVPDAEKVEQRWQEIVKGFSSQAEFEKALASQKITEAQLRHNIEESVKLQQVLDLAVKDIPRATDEDIEKFYRENPQRFTRQEQVRAAHILLLVGNDATPEKKAEIRKKIEEIRAEIESKKISFSEAAAKYSEDKANAAQGGELGYFTRGRMVPQFEEAAFETNPGSVSGVVETQFGFHLIHVTDRKPAGKVPLEEVKADIKNYLDQTAARQAVQKYVEALKANAVIENYMTAEEFINRHMAKQ